ncbi:hypothetical protein BRC65_01260 [Halobacteriales archaeon QH_2_65_14]|nr:MAG: hypothetical protein BRC65_01260 [Halobacteriales archaeon QH_2_65_14]
MRACTYCRADIDQHDPICVRDCDDNCSMLGQFCNYACLVRHAEANDLTAGAACKWHPERAERE